MDKEYYYEQATQMHGKASSMQAPKPIEQSPDKVEKLPEKPKPKPRKKPKPKQNLLGLDLNNLLGFFGEGITKDHILIIGLILLLFHEKADKKLIGALVFLLL